MFQTHLSRTLVMAGIGLLGLLPLTVSVAAKTEATTLQVDFDRGELMSIISIVPKSGEAAAGVRSAYLRDAFKLSAEYGLRPMGNLVVSDVIIGKFSPGAVAFYAWPSIEAEARFNADSRWSPIRATRPGGWDELRIHDVVSEQKQSIVFSSDRFYTLATAWVDPQQPDDYEHYLSRIEDAVAAAGGRFVFEMVQPAFTSLLEDAATPSRLTVVEWEAPESLDRFLASKDFERHSPLLYSGTTAFELLGLTVRND